MSRPNGDAVLMRDAARAVGVRVTLMVGIAMLLLIGLVALLVVRQQDAAADSLLRRTAASADDVGDPPPASWLVISTGDRVESSPGLPGRLVEPLAKLRDAVGRRVRLQTLQTDTGEYRVVTSPGSEGVVQVVLDRAPALQERDRLLKVMAVGAVVALAFAGLLGIVVGRRAVRPLGEALSLQRAFIADASHELRTPLTLLSTRAQVLDRELAGSGLDEALLADSRGVVHDVQRLGEVVEDLLVAADPRADAQHVLLDVRELVEAAVSSAHAHAAAAGVGLVSSSAETATDPTVLGSTAALRRALLALVDNAIDHTPSGGQVSVAVRQERKSVVVRVSDTGPGIRAADTGMLMRRFHSGGHRSTRAHYGLGLALTHDVANRHGGQLRLVPSREGASFELVLPAHPGS